MSKPRFGRNRKRGQAPKTVNVPLTRREPTGPIAWVFTNDPESMAKHTRMDKDDEPVTIHVGERIMYGEMTSPIMHTGSGEPSETEGMLRTVCGRELNGDDTIFSVNVYTDCPGCGAKAMEAGQAAAVLFARAEEIRIAYFSGRKRERRSKNN